MSDPLPSLPDDLNALKAFALAMAEKAARAEAEVVALKTINTTADARIARLMSILKSLERAHHGKRSEKLGPDATEQQSFVFEEIETGIAELKAGLDKAAGLAKTQRAPRPRKGFAAHLERIDVVIEPEIPADCLGLEKVRIGEDVSERLDVVPAFGGKTVHRTVFFSASLRVIVTHRPKYAFRDADGVVQALAPNHIIEGGIPTEALLAMIAVSKYADGLPLYRQAAIYARDGVDLDRSLTAPWMGRVGFELEPLAEHLMQRIKQAERIFADETTLPTLNPGAGKAKTAYLWAYARDDRPFGGSGPPMVAYHFEDSRAGTCVDRHLAGYRGICQVDGYNAYQHLEKPERGDNSAIVLAGCWAHVRRKFYDLHANGESELATATVERMRKLWAVEDEVRGHTPEIRAAARRQTSASVIDELFKLWEKQLPRLSQKSKLADAIRYATSRRRSLERFLDDGRIEIDSNVVERAIRPQTITRKNSLFAGSDGGGRTWATIASLLQTARMNDVDPVAWLKLTLERLADNWPNSRIDELMPWNFKA